MLRRTSFIAILTFVTLASMIPAAAADGRDDADVHRTKRYHARSYARWVLGDGSAPPLASLEGDCGAIVRGRFYIAPPIDRGLELTCRVRHGLPIVFSHAGWFTSIPADGDTDAQIVAAARAGFATIVDSWVLLDGERVGVGDKTRHLGAFWVRSETGSFYDAIGVGTGPIRTALSGSFLTIAHLGCGRHTLEAAADFGVPGGRFGGTWHLRVRGCDDD